MTTSEMLLILRLAEDQLNTIEANRHGACRIEHMRVASQVNPATLRSRISKLRRTIEKGARNKHNVLQIPVMQDLTTITLEPTDD